MNDLIKTFDDLPLWLKIIFALPGLDIIWAVYRVVRSFAAKNTLAIVLSIVLIIVGIPFLWLVDIIFILLKGKVWWFC